MTPAGHHEYTTSILSAIYCPRRQYFSTSGLWFIPCGCHQDHIQETDTDTRSTMYTKEQCMTVHNKSNEHSRPCWCVRLTLPAALTSNFNHRNYKKKKKPNAWSSDNVSPWCKHVHHFSWALTVSGLSPWGFIVLLKCSGQDFGPADEVLDSNL